MLNNRIRMLATAVATQMNALAAAAVVAPSESSSAIDLILRLLPGLRNSAPVGKRQRHSVAHAKRLARKRCDVCAPKASTGRRCADVRGSESVPVYRPTG